MSKKLTQKEVIERFRKVHGDKYDYSKVEYVNTTHKVCIICPIHGEFWQSPATHFKGGCKKCGDAKMAKKQKKKSKESFVFRAKKVHGDKYDYSKVEYILMRKKVCIICPTHGEFWQTPDHHLQGRGCKKCQYADIKKAKSFNSEVFIKQAKKVHGDKYDYSKVEYINAKEKVCIICPTHGEFWQIAEVHAYIGCGCPKCANVESQGEVDLSEYIKSLGVKVETRNRKILGNGWELDIVIPDYKIAIEFNGLYWHTMKDRNYHLEKTKLAAAAGYRLIHIWEDQWRDRQDVVKRFIRNLFVDSKRIGARQCEWTLLTNEQANDFHDKYHIQGKCKGHDENFGLLYEGRLAAVASFAFREGRYKSDMIRTLVRYSANASVMGGLSKILKHSGYEIVVTHSDNCMFDGKLYEHSGFQKVEVQKPDYMYVVNGKRVNKSNFQKAKIIKRFGNKFPELHMGMTEREMTELIGVPRIYDCGKTKWIWKRDK